MSDQITRIDSLKDHNFGSWFVNIRAELRKKKLWEYTQNAYADETTPEEGDSATIIKKKEKTTRDWEQKSQEAADLMTPTISPGVQQKLTELEFNDGYLMLTRLRTLLQPTGSSEFMRLSKEYYTLNFNQFKTVPEYLTQIKLLEEKIDATKVTLDENNRTILCLSMSLPQEYQYLVQIWAVTPSLTAEKARQMILEASRQHHNSASYDNHHAQALKANLIKAQREPCAHCQNPGHPSHSCYKEFPHLAPEWYQLKMKDDKEKQKKKEKSC